MVLHVSVFKNKFCMKKTFSPFELLVKYQGSLLNVVNNFSVLIGFKTNSRHSLNYVNIK